MDGFKVFPERFSGGSMTYAGAHPADADAVVFCYSSGAGSGTPRPDQLAQQYLDAARKYGVSDGLCVFAVDEVPRDHGVSVADVVSDAVRAVARHNSTAARIVSCVDSPNHHHEVARSADRDQYPIDHSIVVSHDIAALLQRPSKIVDGIAQASSARRDRLELEAGDQTIDGLGRLYGSDPARRAVIAEYRQFLGSSGKTLPPFHLVDVPIGGASLALSNRSGAEL